MLWYLEYSGFLTLTICNKTQKKWFCYSVVNLNKIEFFDKESAYAMVHMLVPTAPTTVPDHLPI